jgi:aryl carrier-like protein
MNRKQLGIIFGVLALLILIYAIGRLGNPGASRPLGAGIPTAQAVDSTTSLVLVHLPGGTDSVRMERRSSGWRVNGYAVDAARLQSLLGALDTARVREVVARSRDNHARMGVDDAGAARVTIGEFTFLLGSSDAGSYYARLPDSATVYLFPPGAGRLLSEDVSAWRDHVIARVDTSAVRRIVIGQPWGTVTLRRVEGGWLVGDLAADSLKVRDLLRTVGQLTASGFASEEFALAADFENPAASLDLFTVDLGDEAGPALSLLFVLDPTEEAFLVRRADRFEVYEVPEWTVRRLLPAAAELIAVSD